MFNSRLLLKKRFSSIAKVKLFMAIFLNLLLARMIAMDWLISQILYGLTKIAAFFKISGRNLCAGIRIFLQDCFFFASRPRKAE